jgi:RimJ/RimL family protein N-acetyltransferase
MENRSLSLVFKPLEENNLDLLCFWFSKAHIKAWWDDQLSNEEIKNKYRSRIGNPIILPYIVYLNDHPFAFIQYYFANKVGDRWLLNEADSTVGIDLFIGDEDMLDQGYGTALIKNFTDKLFKNSSIQKIITDVDPNNLRAKRCYEKSGFIAVKDILTNEGPALMMERYK